MATRTLVLNGTEVEGQGYPPRNPKAQKFGDRLVFTDDIDSFEFKPSSGPSVTGSASGGQHSGFCFKVRAKDAAGQDKNFWLCQAGFDLPALAFPNTPFPTGGQIEARGLMDFNKPTVTAAITGGFGDYNGAEGRVDVAFPDIGKSTWTMTIELP
jgi:hypothetical protein